jgi:hypothetical protein
MAEGSDGIFRGMNQIFFSLLFLALFLSLLKKSQKYLIVIFIFFIFFISF